MSIESIERFDISDRPKGPRASLPERVINAIRPVPAVPTTPESPPERNQDLIVKVYSGLLETRQAALGLIKADSNARELAQAALQERLEETYLKGLTDTDRKRADALKVRCMK